MEQAVFLRACSAMQLLRLLSVKMFNAPAAMFDWLIGKWIH